MRKGMFLLVALLACMAIVQASNMPKNVPYTKGGDVPCETVHQYYPQSKDAADSIINGMYFATNAKITAQRFIDMDPATGAAFIVYRNAAGTGLNYIGTTDTGLTWTLTTGLNTFTTVRYPSAMADVIDNKPWAVYNTGIGVSLLKGGYFAVDQAGYNGGLWDPELRVDSMGAGSGTAGMYIANGHRGTNGTVHWLHNYWETSTPDGALYYNSTDYGATWSVQVPRSGNMLMYSLEGTADSLNIYGGGPVVYDSLVAGFINQVALWGSVTGDTLMIGSCGVVDTSDNVTPRGVNRFWYRMSTDAGATWTPLAFDPISQDHFYQFAIDPTNWYDLSIALDKTGNPHFATFQVYDTTASGGYDTLNCGMIDVHRNPGGAWERKMVYPIDAAGVNNPHYAKYGMDVDGNLFLVYTVGTGTTLNIHLAMSKDDGDNWVDMTVTTDGQNWDYSDIPSTSAGPAR